MEPQGCWGVHVELRRLWTVWRDQAVKVCGMHTNCARATAGRLRSLGASTEGER